MMIHRRYRCRGILQFAFATICILLVPRRLNAAAVPGEEGGEPAGDPVTFPHPAHLTVLDAGGDTYWVTFRWTPGQAIENAGVAGSFNGWSRTALAMTDEDGDGTYEATARIQGGRHIYKLISGSDGWHADPANPDGEADGYGASNSVLRLGISAIIENLEPRRGDGEIETRAFGHDPEQHTYLDVHSLREATIRMRALSGDATGAGLILIDAHGGREEIPMLRAGSDGVYEFFEVRLNLDEVAGNEPVAYGFAVHDGDATVDFDGEFPLAFNASDIFETPDWAKRAVWYQIMVDRFRDGDPANNPEHTAASSTGRQKVTHPWGAPWYVEQPYEREGDKSFWQWSMYERLFGGDFAGVIEKLDYLRDLGVTAIYLNPIFESFNSHKYNARSFVFADDGYGVAGEFDKSVAKVDLIDASTWVFNKSDRKLLELIEECHERGMKIIFDGVFNHVGDDSVYFLDVKENGRASKFADWFHVTSWEPFEYTGWAGFGGLPEFEKDAEGLKSPSLTQHIFDITARWMDPNGDGDPSDGIDGWRLDVPMHIPKPFWVKWRTHVKSINPEAYIVGEIWDPAEEWLAGDTFDAVMNYPFAKSSFRFFGNKANKISASEFDRELARLRSRYPRSATYVLQNLFDSHDTDRWVSRLANPDLDYDAGNRVQDNGPNYIDERPGPEHYRRMRLMAVFQATYVGAPMIWYGDEIGMFGADDPMCRMPMWWDDRGPFEDETYTIDEDLRAMFRELFRLRSTDGVLQTGDYLTLMTSDDQDSLAFLRYDPSADHAIVVALNNSATEQTIRIGAPGKSILPAGLDAAQLLHAPPGVSLSVDEEGLNVVLPAVTGTVIRVETARE